MHIALMSSSPSSCATVQLLHAHAHVLDVVENLTVRESDRVRGPTQPVSGSPTEVSAYPYCIGHSHPLPLSATRESRPTSTCTFGLSLHRKIYNFSNEATALAHSPMHVARRVARSMSSTVVTSSCSVQIAILEMSTDLALSSSLMLDAPRASRIRC